MAIEESTSFDSKQIRNPFDLQKVEMPFLNLNTNLSKDKVTAETMNKLAQEMSVILGKDTKWINWMLSTDKLMSRVSRTGSFGYSGYSDTIALGGFRKSFTLSNILIIVSH